MSTYKVIQDIEAEDKLLGPLSLRQFIYAAIVAVQGFIMYKLFFVQPFMILPFLPTVVLFGFLAGPFGRDQSSEIWLLAKIRFALKPRVRIWDQTGLQELVTVTAPKRVEHTLTNGLDETQVRSRLQALAQTIDTRGWVVKGMDVNLYTNPTYSGTSQTSDRLIDESMIAPQSVDDVALTPVDDMLDTRNNPVAQQLDQMVTASGQAHRRQVLDQLQHVRDGGDLPAIGGQPFVPPPQSYATFTPQTIQPVTTMPGPQPSTPAPNTASSLDDQLWTAQFQQNNNARVAYGNTHVLQPNTPEPPAPSQTTALQDAAASQPPDPVPALPPLPPMTDAPKPDILDLANNDDLSVATIARQANKRQQSSGDNDGEIVIPLR